MALIYETLVCLISKFNIWQWCISEIYTRTVDVCMIDCASTQVLCVKCVCVTVSRVRTMHVSEDCNGVCVAVVRHRLFGARELNKKVDSYLPLRNNFLVRHLVSIV